VRFLFSCVRPSESLIVNTGMIVDRT